MMPTNSFTDTYLIDSEDIDRFHQIMTNTETVTIKKVTNHQDIKGEAILKLLGIDNQ